MKFNRKYRPFLFGFLLAITSCSGYNRMVKGDDYRLKFETANGLFDRGQYLRSIALYEQIYQKMPKTGEGELAYYRIARGYYAVKDYDMAGYYFGSFIQRFSNSVHAHEAMFLSAMCSVFNSPEASLDQNDTEVAINNLQQFINGYPESALVDSCNRVMDRLRLKLEFKDLEALKLYDRTENYRAAVTTSETFLADYPRSKNRELVSYLLLKNAHKLALNSIDSKKRERIDKTLERYLTFVSDFPDSSFKKYADKISDELNKELQNIKKKTKSDEFQK